MNTPQQILLVDDNPANLKILYETLDGRGYRLLVADNGEKALTIARKSLPDLILLDIMMPGLDGFEVCRQLKADPRTSRSAVIFLSALDDIDSKLRGFDVGGVDYVSKPFQVREVLARAETQLKISSLERSLEARNKELSADKAGILNAMSEGVYGLDGQGSIVFANPAAVALTGWREPELLGHALVSLHCPEGVRSLDDLPDERGASEALERALQAQQALPPSRGRWLTASGEWHPFRYSVTPVPDQQANTRAVVVFQDIQDELSREAELARTKSYLEDQRQQMAHISRLSLMGEMAAGIAHEVNQPLTAVVNYSRVAHRLLKKTGELDRGSLDETLSKIEGQAERASKVIQHIRNFVRKPTEGKESVDVLALAEVVLELAHIEVRSLRADISCSWPETLPAVSAEPIQIQQVALNLIRNAVEACAQAGIAPKVEFILRGEANKVCFIITDNGPGVSEAHQQQLFQPFFTTKETGMGIGLTLCQSIIHAHGGEIGYRREADGRSTFYFWLPVSSSAAVEAGSADVD